MQIFFLLLQLHYFNDITHYALHRNNTLTEHNTFVTFEAAVEASANKIREQLRQLPWLTNQNRNRVNQGFSLNIYIYIVPLAISCTLPIYDNLPNLGPRKILYFPCAHLICKTTQHQPNETNIFSSGGIQRARSEEPFKRAFSDSLHNCFLRFSLISILSIF